MSTVIGIALCLDDRGRYRQGRRYQYVDADYARAIEVAGAVPLYLPLQDEPRRALERVDGLLLPGGDDLLPPSPYPDGVRFEPVPELQLRFDRALLRAALEAQLPVLGICYGMQLLALERGGALHYDIATDVPEAAEHQLADPTARHSITIEGDTLLAKLLGSDSPAVNSAHHQAVADPGAGMRICARAADGLIEAIESTGPGFALGVQWHPEKLAAAGGDALFAGLVEACAD